MTDKPSKTTYLTTKNVKHDQRNPKIVRKTVENHKTQDYYNQHDRNPVKSVQKLTKKGRKRIKKGRSWTRKPWWPKRVRRGAL